MSTQASPAHPMKGTGIGFMFLLSIATGLSVAEKFNVIEATTVKRGTGVVIGVILLGLGILLPKLRPRNDLDGNLSKAAAAERLAGWMLLLAGITYIALFLFAPLDLAKTVSSIIGISTIAAIALYWSWLSRDTRFNTQHLGQATAPLHEAAPKKSKRPIFLFVPYFYAAATACVAFLLADKPWAEEAAAWMAVVFWMMYAAMSAAVLSLSNRPAAAPKE